MLVIEDDPELRELLRVALTADGYSVSTAADGRDGLRHLRSTASTCIIVLDLALPVMDGRQFRAAQLRDRSLAWIPVVLLSGDAEATQHARQLGVRSLVRKPVDVDVLRRALRRVGCRLARPRVEQRSADSRCTQ
ncbi:MAG TPA: response regulator [Vicinamibacterales bacterium]